MVKLNDEQKAELEALEKLSDDELDLSDIPERPIDWSEAKIGMHYKPDWQDITLRLDQNVIDWFEEHADTPEEAHRDINQVLMEHIWYTRFPGRTPTETAATRPIITAGSTDDINKDSGQWMIVDIGFSSAARSCGVWTDTGTEEQEPCVVTFGELVERVTKEARKADRRTLNLLIEAPLSVAFQQNKNPTRRSCDIQGKKYRDWYVNAGATTLIAAGSLLRELNNCQRKREVRLFEGLVSFKTSKNQPKSKEERSEEHKKDVLKLKNAVWSEEDHDIFAPEELRQTKGHCIKSAFHFFDEKLIPPVIRTKPDTQSFFEKLPSYLRPSS